MRLTSIENHYLKIIFIVFTSQIKGNIHKTWAVWMEFVFFNKNLQDEK
jgi:hypothetical protein